MTRLLPLLMLALLVASALAGREVSDREVVYGRHGLGRGSPAPAHTLQVGGDGSRVNADEVQGEGTTDADGSVAVTPTHFGGPS